MYVVELHGSISYGDGATCWENAFQAFGSAKFFWGRTQTPPHGLRNFGAHRVGLRPTWSAPQAKNPSYAPDYIKHKSLERFRHSLASLLNFSLRGFD